MTQIATINTGNYAAMAEAMGMSVDSGKQKSQASTLARLRINHSAIMGEDTINGKKVKMEVVVWWYIQTGNSRWAYLLCTDSYYPPVPTTLYVQEVHQG